MRFHLITGLDEMLLFDEQFVISWVRSLTDEERERIGHFLQTGDATALPAAVWNLPGGDFQDPPQVTFPKRRK